MQQLGLCTGNALSLLQLCVESAGWIRPRATRGTWRIRALATGAELGHTSVPVTLCRVLSLLLPHTDTHLDAREVSPTRDSQRAHGSSQAAVIALSHTEESGLGHNSRGP